VAFANASESPLARVEFSDRHAIAVGHFVRVPKHNAPQARTPEAFGSAQTRHSAGCSFHGTDFPSCS
jgi:hypothetical protein